MSAFAANTPGNVGNVAKGFLRGPGFWNLDASLSRNISLGEARRLELRVETFNVFNHVNWADPSVNFNAATAGMITATTGNPRILQFATKFAF
jgi:hypothetical protein